MSFAIGDRAPGIFGATADGRFYSLDAQAGRPAVLVALGALGPDAARRVLDQVRAAQAPLVAAGIDVVPIAPMGAGFASAFAADSEAREAIVYLADAGGLERLELDGRPAAIFIDRGGRILDLWPIDEHTDLTERHRQAATQSASEVARRCTSSAPVLIIPNVASRACCEALIAHFEASPHTAGVMASYSGGVAGPKLDESKKRRRDIELTPGSPLHAEVLEIMARRCVPEMKRAFQTDIATVDRILIARYDDSGGYFKRHRDNAAPPHRLPGIRHLDQPEHRGLRGRRAAVPGIRRPPLQSAGGVGDHLLRVAAARGGARHQGQPLRPSVIPVQRGGPGPSGRSPARSDRLMLIRRSSYVHLTPLGGDRVLVVHAISQLRLVIDPEVAGIVAWFGQPRDMPARWRTCAPSTATTPTPSPAASPA